MRTKRSLLAPLATAALCAAATSAGAQRAAAPASVRPIALHTAVAVAPAARTVAVYHFGSPRAVGLPTLVTLADSAGKLMAAFSLAGSGAAHPMTVDVLDSDLVLKGATPAGLLTLVLYRQNDSDAADAWVGRWSLGDYQGELRGRALR